MRQSDVQASGPASQALPGLREYNASCDLDLEQLKAKAVALEAERKHLATQLTDMQELMQARQQADAETIRVLKEKHAFAYGKYRQLKAQQIGVRLRVTFPSASCPCIRTISPLI
jgi:hypothetical protein